MKPGCDGCCDGAQLPQVPCTPPLEMEIHYSEAQNTFCRSTHDLAGSGVCTSAGCHLPNLKFANFAGGLGVFLTLLSLADLKMFCIFVLPCTAMIRRQGRRGCASFL